ncbi:MAG: HD domain-containing protein [Elusimicrobia bacterium]|nr:HD domain-containing protein [Elusimicrobiota bacterium]
MISPAALRRLRAHPLRPDVELCLGRRRAYAVGGSVRDACLGRMFTDLDVACDDSRGLAAALARRKRGALVVLDEETRVYRVAARKSSDRGLPRGCAASEGFSGAAFQADFAEIRGRDILSDLARRDFTVDSIAVPLPLPEAAGAKAEAVDPFGGLSDLKWRLLRRTGERIFEEDPLRLLRAFRLASRLGLSIEPGTLAALRSSRRLILRAAGERIRGELLLLFCAPDCARWLEEMDQAGLLTTVFEDLEPGRRCAEVYYGPGGVLRHTLEAVARMDFLLAGLRRVFGRLAGPIQRHLAERFGSIEKQSAILRLAVLLHDVAKPECARRVGGRLRFFGHERRGAERVSEILRRLRFSREEEQIASTLALHHLRPGNLAANDTVSNKAVFRFFRDLGRLGVSQLLLAWADHASYLESAKLASVLRWAARDPHTFRTRAALPEETAKTLRHLQVIAFLLRRYFLKPEASRPQRLLDGRDVMDALGLPPGPPVGETLRKLEEAQGEGRVRTREEALRFIRRLRLR